MRAATSGLLYDGAAHPIGSIPLPPYDGPEGVIHTRPICMILVDLAEPDLVDREDVDLIYVLPLGVGPHPIASLDLAEMVACVDNGGRIALHATHQEAIAETIGAVLALSGGGRA